MSCLVDKIKNGESFSTFSVSVPRPGIEPGWVSPLVFETSASTYSAIWASDFSFASAKIECFFKSCKKLASFFLFYPIFLVFW